MSKLVNTAEQADTFTPQAQDAPALPVAGNDSPRAPALSAAAYPQAAGSELAMDLQEYKKLNEALTPEKLIEEILDARSQGKGSVTLNIKNLKIREDAAPFQDFRKALESNSAISSVHKLNPYLETPILLPVATASYIFALPVTSISLSFLTNQDVPGYLMAASLGLTTGVLTAISSSILPKKNSLIKIKLAASEDEKPGALDRLSSAIRAIKDKFIRPDTGRISDAESDPRDSVAAFERGFGNATHQVADTATTLMLKAEAEGLEFSVNTQALEVLHKSVTKLVTARQQPVDLRNTHIVGSLESLADDLHNANTSLPDQEQLTRLQQTFSDVITGLKYRRDILRQQQKFDSLTRAPVTSHLAVRL